MWQPCNAIDQATSIKYRDTGIFEARMCAWSEPGSKMHLGHVPKSAAKEIDGVHERRSGHATYASIRDKIPVHDTSLHISAPITRLYFERL